MEELTWSRSRRHEDSVVPLPRQWAAPKAGQRAVPARLEPPTVSEGLLNGLYIIPILAVLIVIHEIGHFASARAVGVTVEEFGIGIPPRIKGWTRNGVIWSLNAIPFGGFVRVLGEDGKSMDPGSMNTKRPLQRAFFLVAGSAMNLLLALVLMMLVVGVQGLPFDHVYIDEIVPASPAAEAGWRQGDRIVEMGGASIEDRDEVSRIARDFAGRPMSVVVERDGALLETSVVPRENPPANQGPTGVGTQPVSRADLSVDTVTGSAKAAGLAPGDRLVSVAGRDVTDQYVVTHGLETAGGFFRGYASAAVPVRVQRGGETRELTLAVPARLFAPSALAVAGLDARIDPIFEQVPAAQVIPRGFSEAWQQMSAMLAGLRDLVTGQQPLSGVAGPIGMGQITSEVIGESVLPLWVTLAQISILLSLNLAVLNLLPLPALDGGRLLFVVIEILRGGRRIAPEREGVVHFAGLVILLGFMFVVAFLDVGRLLDGRSFLP